MKNFTSELTFKTSRSSGSGGQNVNKVETQVTVLWNLEASNYFSEEEKLRIQQKLKNRINSEGILQFSVSESRTQIQNKKLAIEKILYSVERALQQPKHRKATKPSKSKIEKRLQTKKYLSEKKENRRFRL